MPYNRPTQEQFRATRRVAPYDPQAPAAPAGQTAQTAADIAHLKDLAQLHAAGELSDEEFASFKAKLLGPADETA